MFSKSRNKQPHWGGLSLCGAVFIVLGILCYAYPVASTVAVTYYLASFLLASGVIHLFHSLLMLGMKYSALRFLQALVPIAAGTLLIRYPGGGMEAVGLMLSFYFILSAAAQWIATRSLPISKSWGYTSAAASLLLGLSMIAAFPFAAYWMPGLLLGIDFVFFGANLISLAMVFRKSRRGAQRGFQDPVVS